MPPLVHAVVGRQPYLLIFKVNYMFGQITFAVPMLLGWGNKCSSRVFAVDNRNTHILSKDIKALIDLLGLLESLLVNFLTARIRGFQVLLASCGEVM
jgi:hypothetical protein